jgi:hypothetical protein
MFERSNSKEERNEKHTDYSSCLARATHNRGNSNLKTHKIIISDIFMSLTTHHYNSNNKQIYEKTHTCTREAIKEGSST